MVQQLLARGILGILIQLAFLAVVCYLIDMLHGAELRSLGARITFLSAESTHSNDQLQDLLEGFRDLLKDYSDMSSKYEEAENRRQFRKQAVSRE